MKRWRAVLPWVGLGGVLCMYVVAVVHLHPTNFFGISQDDTFYFSSAKAIAQGNGYIMPSLPGRPVATKYPPLYPWLLSYVWRANPSFPGNLAIAVGLSVCFGLAFLTLSFLFARQSGGISRWEAVGIAGFCALEPIVLYYSASVLTEIPFAALVLATLVVARGATKADSSLRLSLLCGVLAGLSVEMRVLGVALVAGIAISALLHRARKQFSVFCASAGLVLVPVVWRHLFVSASLPAAIAQDPSPGWMRVWIYDTSYVGVWRAGVPNLHIFLKMLANNSEVLLRTPSYYLLSGSLLMRGRSATWVPAVVTAIIAIGLVRRARQYGWGPVDCVLPIYAMIVSFWSFNDFYRFFLPFMPAFVAAYWRETKHLAGMIYRAFSTRRAFAELTAGTVLGVAILAGNALVVWGYVQGKGRAELAAFSKERMGLLASEREAYDWISRSTPLTARVVAYQDGQLYLYTGRQSMRPIVLTTAEFLDPTRLPSDLEHMTDVARAISAGYWLVSDDDFSAEWSGGRQAAESRMQGIEHVLPLVFRSSNGRVRVYQLGCLQNPARSACTRADAVLFPNGTHGMGSGY